MIKRIEFKYEDMIKFERVNIREIRFDWDPQTKVNRIIYLKLYICFY